MAESATEAYCKWFEALPPAVADDLAIAVIHMFPGGQLAGPMITQRASEGLTAKLRRLASTPQFDAGVALTIAALTDFVFLERRDPETWKQSEALLEVLDEAQEALGDFDQAAELG